MKDEVVYDESTLVCQGREDFIKELTAVLFEYYILSFGEVCTELTISPDLFYQGGFIVKTEYMDLICRFPYLEEEIISVIKEAYNLFFKEGKLSDKFNSIRIEGNQVHIHILSVCK
jgi:hypothetical protein